MLLTVKLVEVNILLSKSVPFIFQFRVIGEALVIVPICNAAVPSFANPVPITVFEVTSVIIKLLTTMFVGFVVVQLNVLFPDNATPTSINCD